ncbi:MAG: glycerophosphodiester phosphodiesterase [Candidatus Thiodiazotropha sp. (ex Epidulcina cf. delphinae)]|nr:glycerophosphodiester phosphodiesterase [Candidatus Thiodiazotropha sp. (ex Epidulcina cf. delphinae)]
MKRLNREAMQRPLVIGHRGACGYCPEHTLASYRLAIEMGADFIEPDLVFTRDGNLIARHDNELGLSTDVARLAAFSDRYTTKRVDGIVVSGWFSEDFSLAEIKRLCVRDRVSGPQQRDSRCEERFGIPTLEEVIALVKSEEKRGGRRVGIYPETKFPTYFALEGRHLDDTPIERSSGRVLIETLIREGFTDPRRIFIQSFEFANLIELHDRIMPPLGLDLPLIQLYGDMGGGCVLPGENFSTPYDMLFHVAQDHDLNALYGGLAAAVKEGAETGYGALAARAVINTHVARYATGIGLWIYNLLQSPPVLKGGNAGTQGLVLDGPVRAARPHPLVRYAIDAGLSVHVYPLCEDSPSLRNKYPAWQDRLKDQALLLFGWGVDAVFFNWPDIGVEAKRLFLRSRPPQSE